MASSDGNFNGAFGVFLAADLGEVFLEFLKGREEGCAIDLKRGRMDFGAEQGESLNQ